ncbi:MAG: hypothetical protein ABL971_11165 [Vicinamibacterales bacterium]
MSLALASLPLSASLTAGPAAATRAVAVARWSAARASLEAATALAPAWLTGSIAVGFPLSTPTAEAAPGGARRLPDRELGFLPFGRLALGAREGSPDQTPVDRAVVLLPDRLVFRGHVNSHGLDNASHLDGHLGGGHLDGHVVAGIFLDWRRHDTLWHECRVGRRFTFETLSPQRGHTSLLVIMVCVAGGAAGVSDLVIDHRRNQMVGQAAFPRTIVVDGVTEPKPALLHALPRSRSFQNAVCKRVAHVRTRTETKSSGAGVSKV